MRKICTEKGISPAVAAILLIALAVVAVGSIAPFLGRLIPGAPPKAVSITLEDWSSTSVTLYHGGGDTLNQSDLRLVRNGTTVKDPVGTDNWAAGQSLNITGLSGLTTGDNIRLVYKPVGQVVLDTTLE